mgnify:FL=1
MGKKDKNRLAELLELATQSKTLKAKKKAIQFECCHKDRKGNFALKATDKDYVFKCKICKDKKVDLSIMDPAKGSIEDQLKAAFKTIKSACDLAKMQSSNKDAKTIELISTSLKKTWATIKVLKKALKSNGSKKKKFKKRNMNVATGGRSLFR